MKLRLEPRRLPSAAQLVIVGGTAASFLYAALLGAGSIPALGCLFRVLLGIECPTCGTTHVLLALLAGDVPAALAQNPLVFGFVLAGLAISLNVVAQAVSGRQVALSLSPAEKRVLFWGFWAVLLANWAWVLAT